MINITQNHIKSSGSKIGQYIKYQRQKRQLSINEFSKNIGVDPSYIMRLEKGMYQSINIDTLSKIALGFQMSINDFLHKCQIIQKPKATLPNIEYYLKEMYQFPDEAIADVQLFIELLKQKYKKEIAILKKAHKAYWQKQSLKHT